MNRWFVITSMSALLSINAIAQTHTDTPSEPKKTHKPLARGGSNNGTSNSPAQVTQDVLKWCIGSRSKLASFRRLATNRFNRNDPTSALAKLVEGLEVAQKDSIDEHTQSTLTFRAIERGLALYTWIVESIKKDSAMANYPSLSSEFLSKVMFNYYDLIEVANALDSQGYVQYRVDRSACQGNCPSSAYTPEFEQRYIDYAREQLAWLLDLGKANMKFFIRLPSDSPIEYGANGSEKSVLALLELFSAQVADDLEFDDINQQELSLWAARYSCTIADLRELNAELAQHNLGNREYFTNDSWAVSESYNSLAKVHKQFSQCGGLIR